MPAKKGRLYKLLFFTITILGVNLFYSCQKENCFSIFNNYLLVKFEKADTLVNGKIKTSPLDTLFYSVTAVGNDIVFYDKSDVSSIFALPVNPAEDLTTFKLETIDSIEFVYETGSDIPIDTIYFVNPIPHTITVSYERRQRIISEECGIEIAYIKLNVDEITFQAYELVEDKLDRINEDVNIKVFF